MLMRRLEGSYSIAGAFSSIIAYGILQLKGSLHSWQYLFIIEGAATIGLAILAYFFLPSHASKAWFLNADEKAFAVDRMLRDSGGEDYQEKGISKRDVILAFTDWKICELQRYTLRSPSKEKIPSSQM